jgi:formylglycine-generating enzyme required for sulfatase activity
MNVQTVGILECASKTKGDFMNNEMLFIPRGDFIMGLSKEQTEAVVAEFTPASAMISPFLFYHEAPEHSVKIPDFSISKYEVTNAEYKKFIDDSGYERKELWKELIEARNLNTVLMGWERIKLLVDRTGKPGTITWNNGTYPAPSRRTIHAGWKCAIG